MKEPTYPIRSASIGETRTIHIFTTPQYLREIADCMESKRGSLPGTDLTSGLFVGKDFEIRICVDQEKFKV